MTYANADADGVLRNHAMRFDTRARTFAVKPTAAKPIAPVLASVPSGPSHQIGGCAVAGNTLFVGVGDGHDIARSSSKEEPVGKILRLTLDGGPAPDNPFVDDRGAASLVYAYGFRNPFGVAHVGQSLYTVQNGPALDAFLRVDEGSGLRVGRDRREHRNQFVGRSHPIGGARPALVPSSGARRVRGAIRGTFFFATSTFDADAGGGVMAVKVDGASGRSSTPESFVRYRGQTSGPLAAVAAVAVAKDGLYFAPLSPSEGATSPMIRVAYDGAADYPHVLGRESSGAALMQSYGCQSCHLVGGTGGRVGPSLDTGSLEDRLYFRLNSDRYRRRSEALDRLSAEPFRSFRDARRDVRDASPSAKLDIWVAYKLLEPRFDDPKARMPKLGLTKSEAESIRDVVLGRGAGGQDAEARSFFARADDVAEEQEVRRGNAWRRLDRHVRASGLALVRRVRRGS